MTEMYTEDNLLDRLSASQALADQYEREMRRERVLLDRHLGLTGGDVLSVGAGWHPGRHLFPAPQWRLVAVDPDPQRPKTALERGQADDAFPGEAGKLDQLDDLTFDVVLYRLVLHHVVFQGPLAPAFREAKRLLRPGGALIAIEPGLWHPVGLALAAANHLGLGVRIHGTPDDIPLSPRRLRQEARSAGLAPQVHAVSYGWRRLPRTVQRVLGGLDSLGSLPVARELGHTFMLIARS
jgi:SAM-dependent methyltransferase